MSIIYSWVFQLFIHYYLNHFQITSTVKVIISTIYLLLLVISTDISLSFLIILTVNPLPLADYFHVFQIIS